MADLNNNSNNNFQNELNPNIKLFETSSFTQQQQRQQFKLLSNVSLTSAHTTPSMSTQMNNKNETKKLFVLIETNNDEECSLALDVLKSNFPDANVNVCDGNNSTSNDNNVTKAIKNPSDNSSSISNNSNNNSNNTSSTMNDTEKNLFKNIRLSHINSNLHHHHHHQRHTQYLSSNHTRMVHSNSSVEGLRTNSNTNSNSLSFNDNSMERQESKDSGFWSMSKSSFESMKSLSIHDTVGALMTNNSNNDSTTPIKSLSPTAFNDVNSLAISSSPLSPTHTTRTTPSSSPSTTTANTLTPTTVAATTVSNESSGYHSRRKWKNEHAKRFTNSNSNLSDKSSDNLLIISRNSSASTEDKNELSVDYGNTRSLSKDSSVDLSLDALNTNDPSEDNTQVSKENNFNGNNTVCSSNNNNNNNYIPNVFSQKRRGKLVRDITIDDENLMIHNINENNNNNNGNNDDNNNKNIDFNNNNNVKNEIKENDLDNNKNLNNRENKKQFQSGRVSPPEKRASLIEKQMSIDETYPDEDSKTNFANNIQFRRLNSKKIFNRYDKYDLHRNIHNFDDKNNNNKKNKIPIVRVQTCVDEKNDDDEYLLKQSQTEQVQQQSQDQSQKQQHKHQQQNQQAFDRCDYRTCPCCVSVSSTPSPLSTTSSLNDLNLNMNPKNLSLVEHHSFDEQTLQQQKSKSSQHLFANTNLFPIYTGSQQLPTQNLINQANNSLKSNQKLSFDLDFNKHQMLHSQNVTTTGSTGNFFESKLIATTSQQLLPKQQHHSFDGATPSILYTQASSLDRYSNYPPMDFNLSNNNAKPPLLAYGFNKQLSAELNPNKNLINAHKLYASFDQHRVSEPMIRVDQNELLEKLHLASSNNSANSHKNPITATNLAANNNNPSLANAITAHHFPHPNLHHPLYHLQNPHDKPINSLLSTSTPSIITNKSELQAHESQKQQSNVQSSKPLMFKPGFIDALFNPYLHSLNAKNLQTNGYPFHTYIQNNDMFFNFSTNNNNNNNNNPSQFMISQLGNLNKTDSDLFKQQQHHQIPQLNNTNNNNNSNNNLQIGNIKLEHHQPIKFPTNENNKITQFNIKNESFQNPFNMMIPQEFLTKPNEQNPNSINIFTSMLSNKVNNTSKRQGTTKSNENNKPHICTFCQKRFARSDMLIRHSRLHSGVRPYKCHQCGQEFSRSDHLNTHQRTHTGEKPYKCPYPKCTYAACRKDMITRHLKVHNKNRSPSSSLNSNLISMSGGHGNNVDSIQMNNSNNIIVTDSTSRHTSLSSPSSLSLSVSSPPHFSLSLTPPLLNLEIASDQETQSNFANNDDNSSKNNKNSITNNNINIKFNQENT